MNTLQHVQPHGRHHPPLHHELSVSFCSGDDHIHPDPHGLRRRSYHVVDSVMSLHTEGQGRVWTLKEKKEKEDIDGDKW